MDGHMQVAGNAVQSVFSWICSFVFVDCRRCMSCVLEALWHINLFVSGMYQKMFSFLTSTFWYIALEVGARYCRLLVWTCAPERWIRSQARAVSWLYDDATLYKTCLLVYGPKMNELY
jgi:hypothetical protein